MYAPQDLMWRRIWIFLQIFLELNKAFIIPSCAYCLAQLNFISKTVFLENSLWATF